MGQLCSGYSCMPFAAWSDWLELWCSDWLVTGFWDEDCMGTWFGEDGSPTLYTNRALYFCICPDQTVLSICLPVTIGLPGLQSLHSFPGNLTFFSIFTPFFRWNTYYFESVIQFIWCIECGICLCSPVWHVSCNPTFPVVWTLPSPDPRWSYHSHVALYNLVWSGASASRSEPTDSTPSHISST